MSRAPGFRDGRDDLPFMVHSELDDIGLDPFAFRVYSHIVRRVGGKADGVFWESATNASRHCRMALSTYRKALAQLISLRLVTAQERPGATTVYTLTPKREWKRVPLSDVAGVKAGPLSDVIGGGLSDVIGVPLSDVIDKESNSEESNKKRITSTRKSKIQKASKARAWDASLVDLPACVDRQQWVDFVEHRRKKKSPVTELAAARLLKKLAAHPEHADRMLDDAIANGWTGVFPPRSTQHTPAAPPAPEHRTRPKRFRVNDSVYRPDTRQNEFIDELLEPMRARMSNGEVWDLRGCERWTN